MTKIFLRAFLEKKGILFLQNQIRYKVLHNIDKGVKFSNDINRLEFKILKINLKQKMFWGHIGPPLFGMALFATLMALVTPKLVTFLK